MKQWDNDLLKYYEKELSNLRQKGKQFAEKHPKIASRLIYGVDESPDPHIERLIESFAYLTGRIQQNLDSEMPNIATAILNNIAPQLLNPIPSLSIACFKVDEKNVLPAIPFKIERYHPLSAYTDFGERCRFRTCYDIELWPLIIEDVSIKTVLSSVVFGNSTERQGLLIRVKNISKQPLSKLSLKKLRFHIHADRTLSNYIYEKLFCNVEKVLIIANPGAQNESEKIKHAEIIPVGFNEEESALPYPNNINSAYRLLQEYFVFPEKFLFFDINNIDLSDTENEFDIFIAFKERFDRHIELTKDNILLGCTPIINLFQKLSEPIRINQLKSEYKICPDNQREHITEIYSVQKVYSNTPDVQNNVIEKYFSFKDYNKALTNKVFWYTRRGNSESPEIPGSDSFLSIIDYNFDTVLPGTSTLYADLLCTNRQLGRSISQDTWVESEMKLAAIDILLIRKPTDQINPPIDKNIWTLISTLSLNHLSLSSKEEGLNALKEILSIYDYENSSSNRQQISGIESMKIKHVQSRIGKDNWRGFCRGLEITLEFNEDNYAGNNTFLFASVINHFLPMYSSINSFTQLVAVKTKAKGEIWQIWPPRIGMKELL
jgi:type VI secretion system protein ImpG